MGTGQDDSVGSGAGSRDDGLTTQLLASMESMADGFVLLDREWRFLYVNAVAEQQLLRARDDLLGRSMWDEFPEGRGTIAEIEYSRVLRDGGSTIFELDYPPLNARLEVRAFEMLREGERFDLLFTDVVMPSGMNGRQLADAARAIAPALPVLYRSGNPDIVLGEEGRLASGVNLLRKPYRRRELAAKLREALANHRSQNEA